jgi:hypothetical protein
MLERERRVLVSDLARDCAVERVVVECELVGLVRASVAVGVGVDV